MTITLEAIHLVNEGSFIVSKSHHHLEVKGIRVGATTFVVSDLSDIQHIKTFPREITHYVNNSGDEKSVEDYNFEESRLSAGAVCLDGYLKFPSLDEEFAYKKFKQMWEPVYGEPKVEKTPVKVNITEVRVESGDRDIVSLWNAPGMAPKSHMYSLNRDKLAIETFVATCKDLGLSYSLANHSGIRYAQVEGKYIYDDSMNFRNTLFIGTLEQCKREKERVVNHVSTEINLFIAKKTKPPLKDASQVYEDLNVILSTANKILPTKGSRNSHLMTTDLLRELITAIKGELLAIKEELLARGS